MHADRALLSRGHFPERADIFLGAKVELASSSIQLRLDALALELVQLAVLVLTFPVAVPSAQAPVALFAWTAWTSDESGQVH